MTWYRFVFYFHNKVKDYVVEADIIIEIFYDL